MKLYDLMLDPKFDIQAYIDRLKIQLKVYKNECTRLNNIIKGIEKELKEYLNRTGECKKYVDTFYSQAIYNDIEYILNKLKELKESDENENL